MGSWVTGPVLIDNSAWARLANASLPQARADEIADAVEAGLVYVSLPFLLEAGYSARNAGDHRILMSELRALPYAEIDAEVEHRAVDAQSQLARAGHHRMPPVDLLLSALAQRHSLGILHYDRDFDIVRAKTDLAFDGVWLAKAGSL